MISLETAEEFHHQRRCGLDNLRFQSTPVSSFMRIPRLISPAKLANLTHIRLPSPKGRLRLFYKLVHFAFGDGAELPYVRQRDVGRGCIEIHVFIQVADENGGVVLDFLVHYIAELIA